MAGTFVFLKAARETYQSNNMNNNEDSAAKNDEKYNDRKYNNERNWSCL